MPAIVVVLCCVVGAVTLTAAVGLISAIQYKLREADAGSDAPLHRRIWKALYRG